MRFNIECDCGFKTGWNRNKRSTIDLWNNHREKLLNNKVYRSKFPHETAIIHVESQEIFTKRDLENSLWFV